MVANCGELINSAFLSISVDWDSQKSEFCNPWDLEAVDIEKEKIEHGAPLTTEELQSRLYIPTREEWNGIGRDSECVRIAKALESILECAVGVPMLVHYPRLSDVDYPIDLTMMKERVKNHFYRRISALMSDALQMCEKIPL